MTDERNTKKLPGFYIALCCCVLAIGAAGYFTERKDKKDNQNVAEVSENGVDVSTDYEGEIISVGEMIQSKATEAPTLAPISEPVQTYMPTETPEYAVDNPDIVAVSAVAAVEEAELALPASGEVLAKYSSVLSFNEALGDYRAHNGIDIAADEGCSVSAAADGMIENVFANAMGNGITISHGNGITTKYMCLAETENLKIGDNVKKGDVIGSVGMSKGENVRESHLHFEVLKNGAPVNPEEYLKFSE